MNFIDTHARQSGRTTRMLEEAIQKHKEGRAVYILVHDEKYGNSLKKDFEILCRKSGLLCMPQSIKFETVESLGFNNINWQDKKLHHAHSNCKLLIDHHVYAKYFSFAIEGFHEYDNMRMIHPSQLKSL